MTSFNIMKTHHSIPVSDGLFQLQLKASEPWLIVFSEFYQKVLNYREYFGVQKKNRHITFT